MIKRKRICLFCHQQGITVEFETGNKLRQHVKARHPRTPAQRTDDKRKLKEYRKQQLILISRLHIRS